MAGAVQADDEPIVGINVTPLVDVVLVLLVIFIVTAKLVVSDALPLDLPKAASGGEQQTVMAVELDPKGALAVNQARIGSIDELRALAIEAKRRDPELRVVIKADGDASHRSVVEVMDVLRRVPIDKVAFGVEAAQP